MERETRAQAFVWPGLASCSNVALTKSIEGRLDGFVYGENAQLLQKKG